MSLGSGPPQRDKPVEVVMPADGVFVLESHHAANFRMEASLHEFLEVFYVLSGAGCFRIEGRSYDCRAEDVIVVPVGQLHQIEDRPDEPLSLYGICVAPSVWWQEPRLPDLLPAGRLRVQSHLIPQIRSTLRRMLFEQTLARPLSRIMILGMALQLLAMLARSHTAPKLRGPAEEVEATPVSHREAVRRYLEELRRAFFEPGDIDQAAARLGLSRRRFTQLFREVAGTSWSDHVTGLRIEHACRLLRETPRSIMAIAFECGYEDLSSFYRAFKRRMGLTPSEWRQRRTPA
ncbi:MAG: helix-turn-helix domain-containing protein [Isosphaeraceae bacterium]|nr:helix-turn-helix domain-containing protein [Isosphaeraceae bacterium]